MITGFPSFELNVNLKLKLHSESTVQGSLVHLLSLWNTPKSEYTDLLTLS